MKFKCQKNKSTYSMGDKLESGNYGFMIIGGCYDKDILNYG